MHPNALAAATDPPVNIDGLDWILSQPLGLAVLLIGVFGFATGRIVPGRALQKEQERSDRLAEANKIQAETVAKVLVIAETTQRTAESIHTLMQGIATNLQSRQRGE